MRGGQRSPGRSWSGLRVACPSVSLIGTGRLSAACVRMVAMSVPAEPPLAIVPAVGAYAGIGPEGVMRFAVCSGHTLEMIDDLLSTMRALL